MKRFTRTLLITIVVMSISGCGTLVGYMSECLSPECQEHHKHGIEYYQATKADASLWNLPKENEDDHTGPFEWLRKGIVIVDYPISIAVDTVLFPFQAILNTVAAKPNSEGASGDSSK